MDGEFSPAEMQATFEDLGLPCGMPLLTTEDDFVPAVGKGHAREVLQRLVQNIKEYKEPGAAVDGSKVLRNDFVTNRNGASIRVRIYTDLNNPEKVAWEKFYRNDADARLRLLLRTLRFVTKTPVSAEERALEKLKSLIPSEEFDRYLQCGVITETGKSGIVYLIRKLRPTIAVRCDDDKQTCRFLCALCLHPLGYYEESWVGAMTPTDEVVTHLLLIRGDEPRLWKKANHIPMDQPNSGV